MSRSMKLKDGEAQMPPPHPIIPLYLPPLRKICELSGVGAEKEKPPRGCGDQFLAITAPVPLKVVDAAWPIARRFDKS